MIEIGTAFRLAETLELNSVDLIITSPPYYHQRKYGDSELEIGQESTIGGYVWRITELFSMLRPALKPTGSLLLNIGDTHEGSLQLVPYQVALKLIENDWKLVNHIIWGKLNPTPKSQTDRLNSSHEPFFFFSNTDKYYFDASAMKEKPKKTTPSNKIGQSYFKLIENSNLENWQKEKATASVKDAINKVKSGEWTSFRVRIKGIHAAPFRGQAGGYNMRYENDGFVVMAHKGNGMAKDLVLTPAASVKGTNHPAIFPLDLITNLIKMACPEGGLVLDPFIGSGTTETACNKINRKCIGFELYEKYVPTRTN